MTYDCLTECNGACCRIINYKADTRMLVEFFKARGFTIIDGYAYRESPCPLLQLNKCSIQERKPLICKMMPVGGPECQRARKFYKLPV